MRSYYEIHKQLREVKFGVVECPIKQYHFYFYFNGQLIYETNDEKDCMIERGWVKERVCKNEKEIKNYYDKMKEIENEAVHVFKDELKKEKFPDLNPTLFELCWSKSYDDNHSDGYDSVADGMCDIVEFAENVIKTIGE